MAPIDQSGGISTADINMPPLITLIIPVYKAEKYLDQCISSVVSQTYSNLEIILVDDGSPDSCPAICDHWATVDSRIMVIHKNNQGQAMARNAGLNAAHGQYIGFLDDDDWISTDMYETLLKNLLDEGADYSATTALLLYKEREIPAVNDTKIKKVTGTPKDAFYYLSTGLMSPVIWDKLYKRELFEGLRFPNEILGDDLPVSREIFKRGNRFVLDTTSPRYHYRQVASSQSRTRKVSIFYATAAEAILNEVKTNYHDIAPYATVYYLTNLVWAYEQIIRNSDRSSWHEFMNKAEADIRNGLHVVNASVDSNLMKISALHKFRWLLIGYMPFLFQPLYVLFTLLRRANSSNHYFD